jgi:hypothetical protein
MNNKIYSIALYSIERNNLQLVKVNTFLSNDPIKLKLFLKTIWRSVYYSLIVEHTPIEKRNFLIEYEIKSISSKEIIIIKYYKQTKLKYVERVSHLVRFQVYNENIIGDKLTKEDCTRILKEYESLIKDD